MDDRAGLDMEIDVSFDLVSSTFCGVRSHVVKNFVFFFSADVIFFFVVECFLFCFSFFLRFHAWISRVW